MEMANTMTGQRSVASVPMLAVKSATAVEGRVIKLNIAVKNCFDIARHIGQ